jgi:5'-methylthioadenosine phosphorylase
VQRAQETIARTVPTLPLARSCPCSTALQYAIITDHARISVTAKERLGLLINRYIS